MGQDGTDMASDATLTTNYGVRTGREGMGWRGMDMTSEATLTTYFGV